MSYRTAILNGSPVSYWEFPEAAAPLADSADSNPGTPAGGYTLQRPGPLQDGTANYAVLFDGGVTTQISVADAANLQIVGDLTIEAWLYPTGSFALGPAILDKVNNATPRIGCPYWWGLDTNGVPYFQWGTPTPTVTNYNAAKALQLDQWNYVVVTSTGNPNSTVSFYLNGVFDTSSTQSQARSDAGMPVLIGTDMGATPEAQTGRIAQVAIYNRALPADEIWSHYSASGILHTFTMSSLNGVSFGPPGVV